MPKFRALHNPNFNLRSHTLGRTLFFTDSTYETEDPAEISALRSCVSVEEVPEGKGEPQRATQKPAEPQEKPQYPSGRRTSDQSRSGAGSKTGTRTGSQSVKREGERGGLKREERDEPESS